MNKKLLIFLLTFTIIGVNAQTPWYLTGNSGTNPSSNFIGTTDNNPLIFKTAGNERMKLLSDKSFLGIGVSTPQATLHLHQINEWGFPTSQKLLQLTSTETGVGANNGFSIFLDDPSKDILFKQNEAAKFFVEGPGGGFVIAPEGNIGIGTATPAEMLHITGNILSEGDLTVKDKITVGGNKSRESWIIERDNNGLNFLQMEAKTSHQDTSVYKGSSLKPLLKNRLFISNEGLIGIGTTTPAAQLDVNGSFKAETANITNTLTTNALNAQSANITNTLTTNALNAQNANMTGSVIVNESQFHLSLGNAYAQSLNWGTSYIGFNATRNQSNGTWTMKGGGTNNGGCVIWGNMQGEILFASIPSSGGTTQTLTDAEVKNNIKLHLTSSGKLKAKEVEVTLTGWPDYVFETDYPLMSLQETESFIKQNKHLPALPSAKEVEENGINLGEMNALLLRKVEELTLYILDLQNQINELKKQ